MKHLKITIAIMLLFAFSAIRAEDRHKAIDSIQSLLKTAKEDTARVNLLNELSAQFIEQDDYSLSLSYADQAEKLAQRLRFANGISESLRRIGNGYLWQNNLPKALDYFFHALRISDSLNNQDAIFKLYNDIGVVYYQQRDFNMALEYYLKALKYKRDVIICARIGAVYIGIMNYNQAIKYYEDALLLSASKNEVSEALLDLGTVYEYKNDFNKALDLYKKSLKIKEDIQDNQGMCDGYGSIGDVLFKEGKYYESIKYENKSLSMAEQIHYLTSIRETSLMLNKIYEHIGNENKALYFYKKYVLEKDIIINKENTRMTTQSEMNFQFDKKEAMQKLEQDKRDILSKSELIRKRNERNGFIIGMCVVIIFSVFLFRGYKQTRKAKNIIASQKETLEHTHKELTDNISYAKNLQRSMLPSDDYMKKNLPENALTFFPRDLVSGDFYWGFRDGEDVYFAVADCTGHGSAASLLTVMAISLLNEIVIHRQIRNPDMVLNTLRSEMIKSLNQEGADQERKDGLDISFMKLSGLKLECALANNSLYVVRQEKLIEIKANRFPVGKYVTELPFTLNTMELQKDDVIFAMSDGYVDQFCEATGKKLLTKRFKEWIVELSSKGVNQIKSELEKRFIEWKGNEPQTDDTTMLIVKI